jgi:hypothetical protein
LLEPRAECDGIAIITVSPGAGVAQGQPATPAYLKIEGHRKGGRDTSLGKHPAGRDALNRRPPGLDTQPARDLHAELLNWVRRLRRLPNGQ